MRLVVLLLSTISMMVALAAASVARAADVTVFAAASLRDALTDVAADYKARSGRTAAVSFAASSLLARQIASSRGADIFISADTDWMDFLDKQGLIQHRTRRNLLSGHLALIAPVASKVSLNIAPQFNLASVLNGGRLAIADPSSVPAGKYAKAALTALGVWNSVATHLAPAENVRLALAYVARAEAPLGIVYATDAKAEPAVRIVGTFPDSTHPPIVYPVALTKDARPDASEFMRFLEGPAASAAFLKRGFEIPR